MLLDCVKSFRGVDAHRKACLTRQFHAISRLQNQRIEPDDSNANEAPKRKRGRPRKTSASVPTEETKAKETHSRPSTNKLQDSTTPTPTRTPQPPSPPQSLPPRILHPSQPHTDLASFLSHAARVKLNKSTNVYKGTLYEYTVLSTLSRLGFSLHRTGRANDRGIDLVGHFTLPGAAHAGPREVKVLVQCKALKPTPAMVRELEGAFAGAPAGWGGAGTLALLVANAEATVGVREAVRRSRWPMGLLLVEGEGVVRRFVWNAAAEGMGLAGLGVGVRYGVGGGGGIALTWMGEVWKG